jgi:hypothetical protein
MQLCPQKVKATFQKAHTQLKITCIALANFFYSMPFATALKHMAEW